MSRDDAQFGARTAETLGNDITSAFAAMARERYRRLVTLTPGMSGSIDVDAMTDAEILKLDAWCTGELLRHYLRQYFQWPST